MSTITLQSHDGQTFNVSDSTGIAAMSATIKNLLEDADPGHPVPLPNVDGKILSKIVEYCKYHAEHPTQVEDDKTNKKTDDIVPWDLDFCKVDQSTIFELILAANYLDIQDLLDLMCKTVANMIKGKTPDEIRATFNIKNDFTPAEIEDVRAENSWVEDK